MAKLGEGERQVRLGQDRLAIKQKRAESIYVVLPAPLSLASLGDVTHVDTILFVSNHPRKTKQKQLSQ
jgi:hypothetical protein